MHAHSHSISVVQLQITYTWMCINVVLVTKYNDKCRAYTLARNVSLLTVARRVVLAAIRILSIV